MSLNLIWMLVVGLVIGLVSSVFVRGSRFTGLAQTAVLGVLGYAAGGLLGEHFEWSILMQWIAGIIGSLVLITGYIAIANSWSSRRKLPRIS